MPNPFDYDKAYRDLYAVHLAFTKLGFNSEDLYVSFNTVQGRTDSYLCLYLKTQGKNFVFTVAPMKDEQEKIYETWSDFSQKVVDETFKIEDLERCWLECDISLCTNWFQLAERLKQKGFDAPYRELDEVTKPLLSLPIRDLKNLN